MLTLISTIFGFISGLAPAILKYFQAKDDRKHEIVMAELQMKAQSLGFQQRIEEINVNADVAQEQIALQASKVDQSGIKWIDGILALFSGLVRPAITYSFFGLYGLVKWAQYSWALARGTVSTEAVVALWTENDMAIFCTVIGFWFSGRLLQKFMRGGTAS